MKNEGTGYHRALPNSPTKWRENCSNAGEMSSVNADTDHQIAAVKGRPGSDEGNEPGLSLVTASPKESVKLEQSRPKV